MTWRWSIERWPYLSWFSSALNVSLFPPTFSCAFSAVFLPTVFTVERFTGQASLAPISCGGLEIRVHGLCRGLMWPPLSLMRVDARVGQRLEADSGEGESESLSLPLGTPPSSSLPPTHSSSQHLWKIKFHNISENQFSQDTSISLTFTSYYHSNRVKPKQCFFNIICGFFLFTFCIYLSREFRKDVINTPPLPLNRPRIFCSLALSGNYPSPPPLNSNHCMGLQ